MSNWFRMYESTLNDPTVQRLPRDKFKAWVNLLCVASTHDGVLPPVADLAFLLRPMGEDKVKVLLAELHLKGLLDPVEAPGGAISYAPCRWSERQYRSDVTDPTAAARMQRYRDRKRNARNGQDRHDRNGDGPIRINRKIPEQAAVTADGGLIEVTDEQALRAWDEHGRATTGKPYPRSRRGGWCFPSKGPPGHQAEVRLIGRPA
jgi:hypothetical protein